MPKEFIFPDVGEGIHEGTVVKWHVTEGDIVKADQTIVEVETDKAIVELPSPSSGTIIKRNFREGDVVKVGQVLVFIGEAGQKVEIAQEPHTQEKLVQKENYDDQNLSSIPATKITAGEVLATPSTRRVARELNIDLKKVTGTGPAGRVTEEDVKKFAMDGRQTSAAQAQKINQSQFNVPQYTQLESDKRVPLNNIRKAIAQRMTYSKTHIPHACGMDFVNVGHLVEIREREKAKLEKMGIKLTYLPFCIKAVSLALRKFQMINANFDENSNEVIMKKNINIGIAVDTQEGLLVPVIKNSDHKSISEIAHEIERLATLAKERKLKLEDMKDGTFTITNIGSVGGMFSTPIINPPEVAIVGIHRIKDMPAVREGKVIAGKVMGISMCFDHRVIDGAMATEFMNEVKQYLEDPDLMLLKLE